MTAKKIWANFSVADASRTRAFYTHLGFEPSMANSNGQLASFLFGDDHFVIHFFEQGSGIDTYLPSGPENGEVIFTLSAESEAEVNDWMQKVKEAGGTLHSEAGRDEAGYYGFTFADPDGHKFNILLMDRGL